MTSDERMLLLEYWKGYPFGMCPEDIQIMCLDIVREYQGVTFNLSTGLATKDGLTQYITTTAWRLSDGGSRNKKHTTDT